MYSARYVDNGNIIAIMNETAIFGHYENVNYKIALYLLT